MFRVRLAVITGVSFGFVLILGWALYWGANQTAQNFKRHQSAYEAFERYERLSQEAYRYFKQRMDRLASNNPKADARTEASKQRLNAAMDALRNSAITAPHALADTDDESQSRLDELERVARFTAFLEASEYRFDEIESLYRQGQGRQALVALSKFSEEEIDEKFQPLIDAAIATERENARIAQLKMAALIERSRWVALFVAATAALFSLAGGLSLQRGLKRPIEALMKGTDEIAEGHLDYRIVLTSQDEFGYLARHFNKMANILEIQREKLREGRTILEQRVAERTAELHRLNADLQRMDVERREFLADISHELRTPITVIRGEAEVALRGRKPGSVVYRDALERIAELAIQLGLYVNDLFLLARAEQARLQFDWVRLDLAEVITKAFEDFQILAQESALTVNLSAPPTPVWVNGDEQRLRQVLFILGDNACRYSKPGGTIAVELRTASNEARLCVRDQGIGIPEQDLERIFDRHFRSKNARRSRHDGLGLGLPMAKSIIKLHGGHIRVTSVEHEGSTFTVTLPLVSSLENTFTDAPENPQIKQARGSPSADPAGGR